MSMFKINTLYRALTLLMISPVALASIEFVPTKDNVEAPLNSYGVGVSARAGLKSITPAGWKVQLHKDTVLPEQISWKKGDEWTQVFASLSDASDLHIVVNYTTKQIVIRPAELDRQEKASRQAILQNAKTPLPQFSTEVQLAPAILTATTATGGSTTTTTTTTTITTTTSLPPTAPALTEKHLATELPTKVEPVVAVQTKVMEPLPAQVATPLLSGNEDFKYIAPVAANKPSVRSVAQGIANRYGLRLLWQAPEGIYLKGPITLMAQTAQEDTSLLAKALGYFSPVKLVLKGDSLIVYKADAQPIYDAIGYTRSVQQAQSTQSTQVAVTTHTEGADRKVALVQKSEEPEAISLEMYVAENTALEDQIAQFLTKQGYTLEWKVEGGFNAKRDMVFKGKNIQEVLAAVLPKLGVSADINTRDKHVIVRPGDAILDR